MKKVCTTSLYRALRAVHDFMSGPERPACYGVRLREDNRVLSLAATNGHSLAVVDLAATGSRPHCEINIPGDRVSELVQWAKDAAGKRPSEVGIPVGDELTEITTNSKTGHVELRSGGSTWECASKHEMFPPIDQVTPPAVHPRPADVRKVSVLYLERVARAARLFAGGKAKIAPGKRAGLEMSAGGELDPIRFDFEAEAGTLVMVLMPMRR